jgi:hypothetical protein
MDDERKSEEMKAFMDKCASKLKILNEFLNMNTDDRINVEEFTQWICAFTQKTLTLIKNFSKKSEEAEVTIALIKAYIAELNEIKDGIKNETR